MEDEIYLIYFDMLGYKELADKIGEESSIKSSEVRLKFFQIIQEKLEIIRKKFKILGSKEMSDDWLIAIESKYHFNPIDSCFEIIDEILDHSTPYLIKEYNKIPLEIGIGIGKYDKWAKFEGNELLAETSTVNLLKTDIVGFYRSHYKKIHGESIRQTFIVLTESVYNKLSKLDKGLCEEIIEQNYKFYNISELAISKLAKMLKFLKLIHHPRDIWIRNIDYLYVPPIEYEEILKHLKTHKIIFITGTPDYGKTFTAVKIMWDFYKEGFNTKWIRKKAGTALVNIISTLQPRTIIYFEDPFGFYRYKKDKDLEKEIAIILEKIKEIEDIYLIITSRKDFFLQFEKEKDSNINLKFFEKQLEIDKPSYDRNRRWTILMNYANFNDCIWLKNPSRIKFLEKKMESQSILQSPFSIKSFTVSTHTSSTQIQLEKELHDKSDETYKVFIKEIKNLSDDKKLFLSLFCICEYSNVNIVKKFYNALIISLDITESMNFDELLRWYINKIEVLLDGDIVYLNHTYFSLIEQFLTNNHFNIRAKNAFYDILEYLIGDKEGRISMSSILEANFHKIDGNLRNMFYLRLSDYEDISYLIAYRLIHYFFDFKEDIRYKMLVNLSKFKESSDCIYEICDFLFDIIPGDIQYDLLINLSENNNIEEIIYKYFELLDNDIRNEFLKDFSDNESEYESILRIFDKYYDHIPQQVIDEILLNLSVSEDISEEVAKFVLKKYDHFQIEILNELLVTLSEWEDAAEVVFIIYSKAFNRIPRDVKDEIFFNLNEVLYPSYMLGQAKLNKDLYDFLFRKLK